MRCLVWISVASPVVSVSRAPVVFAMSRRRFTALTLASSPWSITLMVSSAPTQASVIWRPPVPQPRAIGISRDPNGTWWPGIATALRIVRRISRFAMSSRNPNV